MRKLDKNQFKKIYATLTAVTTVITLTGCSNSVKTNQPSETITSSVTTTYVTDTTGALETTNTTETTVTNPTRVEYDGTYSKEMWELFINNEWEDVTKVIKTTDKEGFKTALYLLNIDTLKANNSQLLYDYLIAGDSNNTNDDLNKIFKNLSAITTHNLTIENNKYYYSYSELLADENDKEFIKVLDKYALKMIEYEMKYNDGTLTQADCENAKELYDEIEAFELGTGKINGKALTELSKGGIFASEEVIKVFTVRYRNIRTFGGKEYVSQEQYEKFSTSINSNKVLSQIQADWNYLAGGADMLNPITKEKVEKVEKQVDAQLMALYNEGRALGLEDEEVKALFTIANIDYFVMDAPNKAVLNKMYVDGLDINASLYLAESAIKKIADYNATVKNPENLYDYSHFIIENQEAIITLFGLIPTIHEIYVEEENANVLAQQLIDYAAYSDQAYVSAKIDFQDGNGVQTIKLDKNSLTVGATDLINKIIYYTFIDNQDVIAPQLVNDAKALTDGTQAISKTQEQIFLMINGVCLIEALDTYEVGHLEVVDEILANTKQEDSKDKEYVYTYTYPVYEDMK